MFIDINRGRACCQIHRKVRAILACYVRLSRKQKILLLRGTLLAPPLTNCVFVSLEDIMHILKGRRSVVELVLSEALYP